MLFLFYTVSRCLLLVIIEKNIYEARNKKIFDETWFRSLLLLCLWKAHSDLRLQCRFTTESLC